MYFKDVKKDDEVFGLIFGAGVVTSVCPDCFYTFEVTYDNQQVVPYTTEGIPAWNINLDFQTVFYEYDINYSYHDFGPIEKIMTPKQIIKAGNNNKLEIRCPSGFWVDVRNCPKEIVEQTLEDAKFHLFRKK